uniref:Hexosyltransferase n=1 Tax=Cyprinus carpio TaxID=7962 RepID=A0A8C1FZ15_CYPCA
TIYEDLLLTNKQVFTVALLLLKSQPFLYIVVYIVVHNIVYFVFNFKISGLLILSLFVLCQYKGQANLHVFEDWCGSSISQLRKNLHFPLYPHTRTTVKKIAVAPKWKNYGLRVFGFIHPYKDGDFQFSIASDDNSELWLSSDESPLNARILVSFYSGHRLSGPNKYCTSLSAIEKPIFYHLYNSKQQGLLSVSLLADLNSHAVSHCPYSLSLTDESSLKMNSVHHIPQTLASHSLALRVNHRTEIHTADMLKPDPRDTFYKIPMIDQSRLENVLPSCVYSPTYVVKDFPIARYQGLQFVYLSYVYPNDFTRLTHMEKKNKCFYRESPVYLEKFGFYKYVKMDEEEDDQPVFFPKPDGLCSAGILITDKNSAAVWRSLTWLPPDPGLPNQSKLTETSSPHVKGRSPFKLPQKSPLYILANRILGNAGKPVVGTSVEKETNTNKIYITRPRPPVSRPKPPVEVFPGVFLYQSRKSKRFVDLSSKWMSLKTQAAASLAWQNFPLMGLKTFTQSALLKHSHPSLPTEPGPHNKEMPEGSDMAPQSRGLEEGEMSEYSYEETEVKPHLSEEAINWQRTFSVNPVDFELLRSDWNDLRCNVSGNLQLAENEVLDVISQYMERLNERNGGIYTLVRIVNVEKRRDSARGNRYLMELLLMEGGKRVVRLSDYIYLLTSWAKPLLCQPSMLEWRHDVMVHFVVPVKNQARWVQQFISDMELLHRETKDENFSVIIVDFQSDDMDVEQALKESTVPRYKYLRREGNFERSSGLQMGVDTIEDSHSIVFLCDLHIHFPHNILETIRKHCVEGRLAFAPIVMRLDCGSSPLEPDGFWEVNGFGLFGIYKSDFDKIGGMNTEEFKDRWGGEDWELLDRVLQNGLEVERLRLRNFYHYFHSKRGMWNIPIKRPSQG